MPALPLDLIGWIFLVLSITAIIAGSLVIIALHRASELEKRILSRTVFSDMLLFGIWILGLVGSTGLLLGKAWAVLPLQFFCLVLIPLTLISAANRLVALKRESVEPFSWLNAISGAAVVVVPVVLICAAAIVTLRNPATLQALGS
ncbi:MAG: hypothetical protein WCR74_05700 [Betaproteobacteria bacterium]